MQWEPGYRVDQLIAVLEANYVGQTDQQAIFSAFSIDSRPYVQPGVTLFFAIKGPRNDGHKHIEELIRKGITGFVVQYVDDSWPREGISYFIVQDSLRALQKLAGYHRAQFTFPVIAITGSNGKTIVKEWLYQLLAPEYTIVRSPKSYNSQVGVALSLLQMQPRHNLAIIEAGISEPGEMVFLANMIRPNLGIFTHLGDAHGANFKSNAHKALEKAVLFSTAATVIFPSQFTEIKTALAQQVPQAILKSWGTASESVVWVSSQRVVHGETHVQVLVNQHTITWTIPFEDEASVANALTCATCLLELGYSVTKIQQRLALLQPVAMRLERKKGKNNCTLINDTYNSDLASVKIALDALLQTGKHRKKTFILSDILQTGIADDVLYKRVSEWINNQSLYRFIGIGSEITKHAAYFEGNTQFFKDTATFLQQLNIGFFSDEDILLKGARTFSFDQITAQLEEKIHDTVMEIHLDALQHNLNYFKQKLKSGTRLMVMVKAQSYGTGGFEVPHFLQYQGVDYLGVAYTDEGVALRTAGIQLPIMVLNPETHRLDVMVEYNLEPEVYNLRSLQRVIAYYKQHGVAPLIHLKLDTGMRRLGFDVSELEDALSQLTQNPEIKVASVFSHLSSADVPNEVEFTQQQIALFEKGSQRVMKTLGYPVLRHILNSPGISKYPEAQFEMVRLGVGMYGVGVDAMEQAQLEDVVRLRTVISQIKHIDAGTSVGYSRKGMVTRPSKIATVPIGYADGFRRSLGNGVGAMEINGQLAPVIGNVCMDMTMLDVTDIPSAQEGDTVWIIGKQYGLNTLANAMQTIPYEVLTSISERVQRIYLSP